MSLCLFVNAPEQSNVRNVAGDFKPLARRALVTTGCVAAVYVAFLLLTRSFPYYGEGGRVVTGVKLRHIMETSILPKDASRRVVVFGNSKILSGFVPETFDHLSGGHVYSYNLGMPNADRFVPFLEKLVEAGNVPTDVLLTLRWTEPPQGNPLVLVHDDEAILTQLVPFRHVLRDVAIFLNRSRFRGGPATLYEETKRDAQLILDNRGYYFISGQSHYPDDRLPDSFRVDSDRPDLPQPRRLLPFGSVYARLADLLDAHDMQAWFVPTYYREGEFRASPDEPNEVVVKALSGNPRFHVLGPDYEIYPNSLFSDRLHLNKEGAQQYTTRLWQLFEEANGMVAATGDDRPIR